MDAIYDSMRGESPKKAVESPAVRPDMPIRQTLPREKEARLCVRGTI